MLDRLKLPALAAMIVAAMALPEAGSAQCLLANPSFEIPGSGTAFGGWNQFGIVASSSEAVHGGVAARLTGPDLGGWDLSAIWQKLDAAPGEQWSASITAWHSAAKPLTGQSRAILNVEWRDSGGSLISYESHTVLDANSPLDTPQWFNVISSPAPTGTASTHFLFGALQSPT
ncbi:MAG: hypothetical protein HKN20_14040, partial [Gemmatimonadetes bacterium]|nr:hypothetical protein [Gemmatimonadota bacterium]